MKLANHISSKLVLANEGLLAGSGSHDAMVKAMRAADGLPVVRVAWNR